VLAALHAAYVSVPYFVSGGNIRSFGLTTVFFDDIAMAALPVGVALFFGTRGTWAWLVLAGSAIVLLGLIATQSRAPLVLGLLAVLFLVWVVWRRSRNSEVQVSMRQTAKFRLAALLIGGGLTLVIGLLLYSDALSTAFDRFALLFDRRLDWSALYRARLWEWAWRAFIDHPFLGVGPGGFYQLSNIYPFVHMTLFYDFLKPLGAHNLLLHFLADMGLVGGIALMALVANQFRLARRAWRNHQHQGDAAALALYAWAFLFFVSTIAEAGWMWGHLSFLAVFFAALIARQYSRITQ
jgi:O-antigen ligase